MRSLLLYLLLIGGLVSPAWSQETAATEKSPVAPTDLTKAEAPPEVNPAHEMLQQAYYLGGQLPTDEHAYQINELLQTAAKLRHPALSQWVQELFQLTAGLPQQYMRLVAEQGALSALADVDPGKALHLLAQLTPVSIAWGSAPQVDDIRVMAARKIFPKYWEQAKLPEIDALRSAANYLGETGQYPFAAVGLILKDVKATDTSAMEMLFLDAMQYYQREQSNNINSQWDFYSFLKAAKGIAPDAMERAAVAVAMDRLLKLAEEPLPDNMVFVGRVCTAKGFAQLRSPAEDILWRMLPLVREIDPDLEQRILEARTGFSQIVPSEFGSLPEGYMETDLIVLGNPTVDNKTRARQRLVDNTRVINAQWLANSDPNLAVKIAQTITDPTRRASTLAAIAQGKLAETDSAQAAKIMAEVSGKQEKTEPKDDKTKLALLVTQARTQARSNDAKLWDTLRDGLDLAEQLFEEGTKTSRRIGYRQIPGRTGPWPGYVAAGFEEANVLVNIGAEKQTANTLGWLAQQRDPALKSYLLISASEGLWNKQKASAASANAQTPTGGVPSLSIR